MNLYLILPFRHHRLPKSNILMVSEVGEYYFIESHDFEKLINYSLKPNDSIFLDLKSKHFITQDNVDHVIKLLATKYRTKKAFMKNFTTLHMMVITLRCNHNCKYCQVSSEEAEAYKWDMNIETSNKIVETIFKSPSNNLKIEFQGGEPIINWDVIVNTVEYAKKLNKKFQKKLEFVICTNLLSINESQLEFINENQIDISTSIDGPKFIHDENRILRTGGSSYDKVINKFELAIDIIGIDKFSALMTTTRFSLPNLRQIIDEYLERGLEGIFIRSLNPYGEAEYQKESLAYPMNEFVEAYIDALEYIIELNISGNWFVEYYAALLLSRILTPFSTGFVDLQSPSGAGIAGVIYDYNGDVYPADEGRMLSRMGDQKFHMGNVFKNSYLEIFNGAIINEIVENSCVETLPGCFSCAFHNYCGSDPIRNYVEQNDLIGHRPSSNFCKKNKLIIEWLFNKLKEGDEKILNVFWSWVTNHPINGRHHEGI